MKWSKKAFTVLLTILIFSFLFQGAKELDTVKASVSYQFSLLQPFYGSKVVDASHNLMISVLSKSSPLYVLTVNVYPHEAGSITVSPPPPKDGFPEGTQVVVTAAPNGKYVFAGWSTDANGAYCTIDSTDNPNKIVMNCDINLTAIFELPVPLSQPQIVIFQIGKKGFFVNSVVKSLDSPPIIENNRTLVPLRALLEAFNGTVLWDSKEKKVTVSFNSTKIELWIGKPQANVNGVLKWIDDDNRNVNPEIINNRTMIPLRFVVENLDFEVIWNEDLKTITIKYPNQRNSISVKKGDTYTITLDENPTTGFKWHWEVSNSSIVQIVSDRYVPPSNNLPGAGGKHEWVIKGISQGTATINFTYYRDFEPDKIKEVIIYEVAVE